MIWDIDDPSYDQMLAGWNCELYFEERGARPAAINRATPTIVIEPRTAVAKSLKALPLPIMIQKNRCSPTMAPAIP